MMRALICEKNDPPMVVKGNPNNSPFITKMMAPSNKMGSTFADIVISHGPVKNRNEPSNGDSEPWSWKDIAYQWIKDKCPLSSEDVNIDAKKDVDVQALHTHPKGVIEHHKYGPGGIH